MARTKISEFSSNPATNTDIDSIFIGEGMAPSNVNDAIRELMSQLKDWQSGTSNDPYVVGSSGSLTLNQGTANGVAYLNGSKVVTSGTALSFDGTNLGVGTSSPAYKLQVTNTSASAFASVVSVNTGTAGILLGDTDSATVGRIEYDNSSNFMALYTNGSERARLDTSGNLGLGVTPSAWGSNVKAFQVTGSALSRDNSADAKMVLSNNAYRENGSVWKYIGSAAAAMYQQGYSTGDHQWYNAPSGTAGNAITFTQAMSLTAAGDLLVGTTDNTVTNGAFVLQGSGAINSYLKIGHKNGSNSGADFVACYYNGTQIGGISQNGTTAVAFNTSSDYRLKNITGPLTNSGSYIDSLNPVEGTWKSDGSTFVGLIAHEVQEASRTQVATGTKDGAEMQSMDYSSSELIANLIAEVKSLRQRVATLEAK